MAIDALMESLEERYALLAMLRGALSRNQVYLRIGAELPDQSLAGLSMVAANYGVPRRNLGTVSLFGPTRMDYRLAMATVRGAAQILSRTYVEGVSLTERRLEDAMSDEGPPDRRPVRDPGGLAPAPARRRVGGAVRVLAKVEAGAYGPEEYAVGVSTRPDAQLAPLLDEADLFTGLSFAEAHWVAAVLASAADRVEDAESLLFDLRVPVDLAWREVELASEVIEPGGLRSAAARALGARRESITGSSRYAIATYTLDCGHQAVELLRQDPDAAPFWVEDGSVDHLVARDARSLTQPALRREQPRGGAELIEEAQANLAQHPEDEDEDDLDHEDDRERD